MKWSRDHNDDGRHAPVPYRLPPSRKTAKAGCRRAALLLLLALALLGCGIADGVRRFAEPIDEVGCRCDCEREGVEFYEYDYWENHCDCKDISGNIITLY